MKAPPITAALVCMLAFSAPAFADGQRDNARRADRQTDHHATQSSKGWAQRRANDARSNERRAKKPQARQHDKQPQHSKHRSAPPQRAVRHRDAHANRHHRPTRPGHHHQRAQRPRPYYNPRAWQPPRHFRQPRHSVYFAYDLAWNRFGLNVERALFEHGQWILFGFSAAHGPLRVIIDSASGVLLSYHPHHRYYH